MFVTTTPLEDPVGHVIGLNDIAVKEIGKENAGQFPDLRPNLYTSLTIKDDGNGMDEETRRRIFEPISSTKFQGRGLGMAAAYGIVKNHGGWIGVDSKLGKGTTVRIFLPAAG